MKAGHVPALMFQGTSSDAGKSLMTAAFCRFLSDEGIKVAPFKAQNMSLNSWVTADGGEMGRAQVLQAAAARVEPSVLMNPVLLKPTGDQGSQVILHGKPLESLQAREYYRRTEWLKSEVHKAYDALSDDYQAIVLEGAGSPGEVNLKSRDIVNMSMARHAEAPVILVGDINRGGVYASFVGHIEVMDPWEQKLVAAFLVNKFRGDATLLEDAHSYMMNRTGKPVVGVMPWVRDHRLPEEDGVDFEERYGGIPVPGESEDEVVIGVVELPHISNSTDLDPFLGEPGVRLVRINSVSSFRKHRPQGVIIPGTRNVIGDLAYLRRLGLAEALIDAAESDGLLIAGICGGFQMLGKRLSDPHGLEVAAGTVADGLGLLGMKTVLAADKSLKQSRTTLVTDGSAVIGYEIHHGQTEYAEKELFDTPGLGCRNGRVWGTYLHGIFENHGVKEFFLSELGRKGEAPVRDSSDDLLEQAINGFTDVFRRSVDVGFLMKTMGL